MNRRCSSLVCSIATLFAFYTAPAAMAYSLTPLWNDPGAAQIIPGSPFNLKFDLASTAGETCDSAIFNISFSTLGMVINSYSWQGSFSGSAYDNSDPLHIHFENFILTDPPFSTGTLMLLNATLPADVPALPTSLSVHVSPGVFALGTQEFIPQSGPDLTISVVPEPSTMILVFSCCLMLPGLWVSRKSFS